MVRRFSYVLDEVIKSLVEFILRTRTIEADEALAIVVSNIGRDPESAPTGSNPSGTWSGSQKCSERIFPATFLSDLLNNALVSGVS